MKFLLAVFSTLLLSCLGSKADFQRPHADVARNGWVKHARRASEGKYPFQVSLQVFSEHECGATILDQEFLLTAAHCIYNGSMDDYTIRAGSNNYKRGGSVHNVIDWIYHENYLNHKYWKNDIAILKIDPPLTYSTKVQPTKLPVAGEEPTVGAASVAIGWGSKCYGCESIRHLHEVSLEIYSYEQCLDSMQQQPTTDMICSGIPGEGAEVCSGDSGGALLVNGTQVGITSWLVVPCAFNPAVWTRVSHYRDWIRNKSGV
ncbi:chymotrypsin-1-like isoform X1 [Periplaneta americana]|uniref:chymotrypsin-1-like isoform X1 n=1 Tax=Periplaneta americana TaxID=6978 RepID=UPI0037E90DAA